MMKSAGGASQEETLHSFCNQEAGLSLRLREVGFREGAFKIYVFKVY